MARKMKDSGIGWIGKIPEGWEIHRIKTHFSIISGSGFKPELQGQSTGDFPVCKASDISSSGHYLHTSANYITSDIVKSQHFSIIPKGSILFAKIGEAMRKNNRSLCSLDCCVDNNCQGLVPKNISSEFSYYLFTCIDMTWFDNAGTIPCINNQKLYDCRIPFPSYGEQTLIANHLNIQCAKINEMLFHIRSSIEEYKKLKQAIITQAVTKGVRGEREMKDSGVEWTGEIPVNWTIQRFARVAEVKSNLVSPDNYLEYPQISPENIEKDSGKLLLPCRTVAEVGVISGNHLFYKGQILYSKIRPKLNKVCIAPFDGLCSADMYPIESKNDTRYIMYCILSNGFLQQVSMITENRVKMPKINQVELSKVLVAIPETIAEQKEIADYLDAKCTEIDGLIAKKEQLVKELEGYKKSLIYEVVTGKREV
ncbi:MAG: restriction endonuclease subunit S [Faecalibacterium sp.]